MHCICCVYIKRETYPQLPFINAGPEVSCLKWGKGTISVVETLVPYAGLLLQLQIILELVLLDKFHPFPF